MPDLECCRPLPDSSTWCLIKQAEDEYVIHKEGRWGGRSVPRKNLHTWSSTKVEEMKFSKIGHEDIYVKPIQKCNSTHRDQKQNREIRTKLVIGELKGNQCDTGGNV